MRVCFPAGWWPYMSFHEATDPKESSLGATRKTDPLQYSDSGRTSRRLPASGLLTVYLVLLLNGSVQTAAQRVDNAPKLETRK